MLRPQLFKNIFIINLKRQAIIGYNMWKLEFVWKHKSLRSEERRVGKECRP